MFQAGYVYMGLVGGNLVSNKCKLCYYIVFSYICLSMFSSPLYPPTLILIVIWRYK